eukprot:s2722_g16.t1
MIGSKQVVLALCCNLVASICDTSGCFYTPVLEGVWTSSTFCRFLLNTSLRGRCFDVEREAELTRLLWEAVCHWSPV